MKKIFLLLVLCFNLGVSVGKTRIYDLKCENMNIPIGVTDVSLSWLLESNSHASAQSACEIEIASTPEKLKAGKADVWKSGKMIIESSYGIKPRGIVFKSARTYWWRVKVWDEKNKPQKWSEPSHFTMGIIDEKEWKAKWISADWKNIKALPCFIKEINVGEEKKKKCTKAIAYICGVGNSDFFVNGKFADETRILDPAQTNYNKYALYSGYDITNLIKNGNNCFGVMLGNGWFNQDVGLGKSIYGSPMLWAQLHFEYSDGTTETYATDNSWLYNESPVVFSNIYRGETYDSRKLQKDWAIAGASRIGWKRAEFVSNPGIKRLVPQLIPAIRLHDKMKAKRMWKSKNGNWIFDFGENNTSVISLNVTQKRDTKIKIQFGEELDADSCIDYRSSGIKVSPIQTDIYICSGEKNEKWIPRSAYHGFRYAEVILNDKNIIPTLQWLTAINVHTNLKSIGKFSCDNAQINRLQQMGLRTFLGNMQGVPVDCPHREKCGWLGDVHAYINMACINFDMNNFLMKYMDDIFSSGQDATKRSLFHLYQNKKFYYQPKPEGIPYMIAPGKRQCGVASPDWGTALVQIPWNLYLYYGNKDALVKYYDFMKQWTDYVDDLAVDGIVYQGLGDWCGPMNSYYTPVEFSSSAFHYLDVSIMKRVATILGKETDERKYSELERNIKSAMIKKFFNPVVYTFGSQTADAMALDLGLCPEGTQKKVAQSILYNMKKTGNFFSTGIFGLSRIAGTLSRNGFAKDAWEAFTKTGNNSFAWMWEKAGATTLWEILPINDDILRITDWRSHSHPMQGGYAQWFYEDILGIRPIAEQPGFKSFFINPLWNIDLKNASGSVNTRYGKIACAYSKDDKGEILWNISVPTGSKGLVKRDSHYSMSSLSDSKNTNLLSYKISMIDGDEYFNLPAGDYKFTLKPKEK